MPRMLMEPLPCYNQTLLRMVKRARKPETHAFQTIIATLTRPVAVPSAAFVAVLIGAHVALCWMYVAPSGGVTFRGVNGFVILDWLWAWRQAPSPFLEGTGFPALPLYWNALFLKLFRGDVLSAYLACELTISSLGVALFFAVCRRLGLPGWLCFLLGLMSLFHYEHLANSVTTHYHDNFFGASVLLAAWGWLGYRKTGRNAALYAAAAGGLLASMSRWEGFFVPILLAFLLAAARARRGPSGRAAVHTAAAALLSWGYVLAMGVHLWVKRIGLGPLATQKTIYAHHFTADALSPLRIYFDQLFWHPKNALILGAAAAVLLAAWALRRRKGGRRLWAEFLVFPAGVLLAYLAFTLLRYGTPKTHLWPGVLLSLPLLFLPLPEKPGPRARAAALAGAAALLAFFASRFPAQLVFDQNPFPPQVSQAGRALRAFWSNGLLARDEKVLVEVWLGGAQEEDRGKSQLGALTVFKTPGQIVFDRYGPSLYNFPGDRVVRIDPDEPSLFQMDDAALIEHMRREKISVAIAHSAPVARRFGRLLSPFMGIDELVFYAVPEPARRPGRRPARARSGADLFS